MYKRPFDVAYYKRICENAVTQAGTQRTFSHIKTLSEADERNCRYVFVIFKTHANNTHQSNYQRCCHANVSNITVRYGGSVYPVLNQNADWNGNKYSRFYKKFINISRNLGYSSPGLSMQEFRDLYTIFAIVVSAQATVSKTNQLTQSMERREVPAQNDETAQNTRDITAFFVIISEAKIQIDCLNKVIRKSSSTSCK